MAQRRFILLKIADLARFKGVFVLPLLNITAQKVRGCCILRQILKKLVDK
jgi:hypothetical protein